MAGHRRSIRLKDHDYSKGFYFVTICTAKRIRCLGRIENGILFPSRPGLMVTRHWSGLKRHFPELVIDAFVIMPDHMHAIVELQEEKPKSYSLATVIQNFKSVTSREYGKTADGILWQRGYYEHIIRKEKELNMIRLYIELNPRLWQSRKDMAGLNLEFDEIDSILAPYRSP